MTNIEIHKSQHNTPILIGHGKDDDIISVDESEKVYEKIKGVCNNAELYIFNGKHKISLSYLRKVREYIY